MSSILEFCPECFNIMVHKVLEGQLKMSCHACHYARDVQNLTIYSDNYTQQLTLPYPIHPEICLDPTLPRTSAMACLNKDCPTHKNPMEFPREIVMSDRNTDHLRGYMCCHCQSYWYHEPGGKMTAPVPAAIDTEIGVQQAITAAGVAPGGP